MLLAAPRGYCAGVDRAVQTVEQALEKYGEPVYVRKQIVHNRTSWRASRRVARSSSRRPTRCPRARSSCSPPTASRPSCTKRPPPRNLHTIDATCPLVTKVHAEARRFAREDVDILLIGHEGHEEVIGTTGQAPDRVHLVDRPGGGRALEVRDPAKLVAWLSQTTLSVDETKADRRGTARAVPRAARPAERRHLLRDAEPPGRGEADRGRSDLVLVVGSTNSSNSVRLVEVALDQRRRRVVPGRRRQRNRSGWLEGVTTVGVTSGASVPEELVGDVLGWLAEHGFGDVEEVTSVPRTLIFALPHELRRDRTRRGLEAERTAAERDVDAHRARAVAAG